MTLFRLFRGRKRFADGAHVGLTVHAAGTVLVPYKLRRTPRGPVSVESEARETWRCLEPDVEAAKAGQVLCAMLCDIRLQPRETRSGRLGGPGYKNDLRACLGLNARAALWKGTGYATVRVADKELVFAASRPEGVPGGFTNSQAAKEHCSIDASDATIGKCLVMVIDLARSLA